MLLSLTSMHSESTLQPACSCWVTHLACLIVRMAMADVAVKKVVPVTCVYMNVAMPWLHGPMWLNINKHQS